jgi:hypothetical protein
MDIPEGERPIATWNDLAPDVRAALKQEMATYQVSAREVLRRSIAVLKFCRDERAAGNKIAVVETVREPATFLWWTIMVTRTKVREVALNDAHGDPEFRAAVMHLLDNAETEADIIRGRGENKG